MNEWEIYEPSWAECRYCVITYEELDNNYRECGCSYYDDPYDMECNGGSIHGCPLAFKYKVEE